MNGASIGAGKASISGRKASISAPNLAGMPGQHGRPADQVSMPGQRGRQQKSREPHAFHVLLREPRIQKQRLRDVSRLGSATSATS